MIDLIRVKLDGIWLWVNMIIDVINKRNLFGFLRFLGNDKEFSGEYFALCLDKFFHFYFR